MCFWNCSSQAYACWAPVAGGAELHSGRKGPLGLAEAVLESVLRLVEDRFSILAGWACTLPISNSGFDGIALNTVRAPVAGGAELHSGREGPLRSTLVDLDC